jgi:hypothetical protein
MSTSAGATLMSEETRRLGRCLVPDVEEVEDFTPTEEQEGYGLIGRIRRMSASEYGDARLTRTLRDVAQSKGAGQPYSRGPRRQAVVGWRSGRNFSPRSTDARGGSRYKNFRKSRLTWTIGHQLLKYWTETTEIDS